MNKLRFLTRFFFTERYVDTSALTAKTNRVHMAFCTQRIGMNKNQIPTPLNQKETIGGTHQEEKQKSKLPDFGLLPKSRRSV
jgi:hypothetical protein